MDLQQFISARQNDWSRLEQALDRVERQGIETFSPEAARGLLIQYRRVCSDLNQAQTYFANADLLGYLHQLVSRGYALIYSQIETPGLRRSVLRFFTATFPRAIADAKGAVAAATGVLLLGMALAALLVAVDPTAAFYIIPPQFQHVHDPTGHARESAGDDERILNQSAAFSAMLMTNNIRVAILAFVLGATAGIGTAAVLFYNGAILGAAIMNFIKAGQGEFLAAWISPHGVIEIPAIMLGGAAGFLIARAMFAPGRKTVKLRILETLPQMTALLLGVAAMLVVAALIEATLSQMGERYVSPALKIGFAAIVAILEIAYVVVLGRRGARDESVKSA